MFLGVHVLKKCAFVNLLFKLNIYAFSSRFKEFKNSENDIFLFSFKYLKNGDIFLLVYGGIVVKMDNFLLFEMVLKFCFTHGR